MLLLIKLKKKNYKFISFFFIENNRLKIKGILGEILLKIFLNINLRLKEKKLSIFLKKKGIFFFFEKYLKYVLIGVSYGWFLNLEVVGRGYFVVL